VWWNVVGNIQRNVVGNIRRSVWYGVRVRFRVWHDIGRVDAGCVRCVRRDVWSRLSGLRATGGQQEKGRNRVMSAKHDTIS
ncbi:MAG: hypothetical protein ACJAYU_002415, partial [Bradymonadia bacterium]